MNVRTAALTVLFVTACGSAGGTGADGAAGAAGIGGAGLAGAGGDAGSAGAGAGGAGGAAGGVGLGGAGGGAGQPPECTSGQATAEVFGHSSGDLYRLDPTTLSVTHVGAFDCLSGDSMIDIAIDKTGAMYGTAFGGFLTIDKATAKCKYVQMGSYPNSLSIVPAGTVSATEETLVGYLGADYVKIDKKTGAVAKIGSLGGGYTSSGDVVSVIGGGTYLTVKGASCNDCVVRVDPTTGALAELLGPTGYTDVFGIAFWAGVVYGFTSAGEVFAYDVATKSAKPVALPGAPKNLSFYGAGSTTCAPALPTPT